MIKKYISLPHDYLSHSQMVLWQSDPVKYKALYFDGRDELRTTNSGQKFGKEVADALEANRDTGDILTDAAMLLLPKYDLMDQSFIAEFKEKGGPWLKIIAKPDTFNTITHEFRETKTGKQPWTQSKAQKHPQMIFYAIAIWLKYGTMNTNAYLDYVQTEQTPDGIKPTGHVESFEVTFKPEDYYEFQAKMLKVAHEIQEAWAAHITPEYINTF